MLDKIENVEMKQFFKSINVALSEHQSSVVELVKRGFDGRHSDPESIILIKKWATSGHKKNFVTFFNNKPHLKIYEHNVILNFLSLHCIGNLFLI